jgi:ribosomal protein S18 acetylase RimI-like enzyme
MEVVQPVDPSRARSRRDLSFETPRLVAVRASSADAARIQSCLQGAGGYFLLTDGHSPGPDAARQLLVDAEIDPDRRVYSLVLHRDRHASEPVLGVLDLHLDYPEPGTAQVGLLLFREASQGQGHGRETMAVVEAVLARAGYRALRLSVVDRNVEAKHFWQRIGFAEECRLSNGVTIYEKPIGRR